MRVLNCILFKVFFFSMRADTDAAGVLLSLSSLSLSRLPLILCRSCARGNSSRRGDTGGFYVEHGGDKEGREEGEGDRI